MCFVENLLGDGNQAGMRDPGAVVAGADFAQLVLAHFFERRFICRRIVLDRDLRRHAAHGVDAAAVARLDQQVDVGLQEVPVHGDLRRGRAARSRGIAEFLDEAEDVVPPAAVQTRPSARAARTESRPSRTRRGWFRSARWRGWYRGERRARLREVEDVVPQTGFQMALQLRQVEVRARARSRSAPWRCGRSTVRNRTAIPTSGSPSSQHVLFVQVPAARAHQQGRGLSFSL